VEDALEEIKGNGRYFFWNSFMIVFMMGLSCWIFQSFSFFEKKPELLCKFNSNPDVFKHCKAKQACNKALVQEYQIDWAHEFTIRNWATELDLICTPQS